MNSVLLVEDSHTDAVTLTQHLYQMNVGVLQVSSCEEARDRIIDSQPDLIVLDVILPGQSGFEFCSEIKNHPQTKHIPVVICSSKGTDADKLWGSMLGADAYVAKPVVDREFTETIQRLLKARS